MFCQVLVGIWNHFNYVFVLLHEFYPFVMNGVAVVGEITLFFVMAAYDIIASYFRTVGLC
jgi:hypothetical protein